jgi:broad specificity phosphatase PhoE
MKLNYSYFFLIITLLSYFFSLQYANANSISLFLQLKSDNHILLLRHSLAPGTGDPDNFNLSDCSTQRNLSKHGVQQAKKIGELFKENNIKKVNIDSSEWCRCQETAKEIALGNFKILSLLNSFFSNYTYGIQQTRKLENWIKKLPLKTPTLLVTHQVNITALTGYYPRQGEIVFAKRLKTGKLKIIGFINSENVTG